MTPWEQSNLKMALKSIRRTNLEDALVMLDSRRWISLDLPVCARALVIQTAFCILVRQAQLQMWFQRARPRWLSVALSTNFHFVYAVDNTLPRGL